VISIPRITPIRCHFSSDHCGRPAAIFLPHARASALGSSLNPNSFLSAEGGTPACTDYKKKPKDGPHISAEPSRWASRVVFESFELGAVSRLFAGIPAGHHPVPELTRLILF
jgi:hypothetical protein